jgi:hypothetical protein
MKHLSRLLCCVIVTAAAILVPINSAFGQSESRSSAKCLNDSNDCPAVVAQLHSSTTQRQVSRFLETLIEADATGALPLGIYGLQGCNNPGPPSYKVTCFLWPSAPKGDLVKLETAFRVSKLFRSVKLRIPSP